jgi:sigma-B regulation protein RsbU (phosphoserine phosphatase)
VTQWSVRAAGCPEDFRARVCTLVQAGGVNVDPDSGGPSASDAVAVLAASPAASALTAAGPVVRGFIEISDIDTPEDVAPALVAGAASGGWFASLHTASAVDFEVAGIVTAAAAAGLGIGAARLRPRRDDIETALRELLMNAAVHGNLELPSPGTSAASVREHHAAAAERMDAPAYRGRRVRIEVAQADGAITFSVIDDGPGYAAAPGPGDDAYSGRGMTIIRALSDNVDVHESGRRTTLTFNLADASNVRTAARPDVLSSVDGAVYGCPILIVDDEEIIVEIAKFQLEDAGFQRLDTAYDGETAWQKIVTDMPDLVILDHSMPGVTGMDLVTRARADDRFRELPIVLVSAHDDHEFRSDALRRGATNVLSKPVDADLLIHRVRQLLTSLLLLRKLRAYRRRVEQELGQAQRMQEALMPTKKAMAALSKNNGVHLAGRFQMSSELGGDWWGLSDFGDGLFGLYTVDFSGHGVGPAINTFRLHTLMRESPPPLDGPGGYLTRLNARLCDIIPRGQYATMLYGIVNVAERTFTYAATGTPAPIFGRADGSLVTTADAAGVPLGLSRRAVYEDRVIELPESGFLFLYSDVLLEGAGMDDGGMLGEDGLLDLVRSTLRTAPADQALDPLVDAFLARSEQPLEDDLTAVWLAF